MLDGGGLSYPDDLSFSVLAEETGQTVFQGNLVLSKAADQMDEDAYKTNHNGTDVFLADFSSLSQPGTYRVYVEGIGRSYPFPIGDDAWRESFVVSAGGFYHHGNPEALVRLIDLKHNCARQPGTDWLHLVARDLWPQPVPLHHSNTPPPPPPR